MKSSEYVIAIDPSAYAMSAARRASSLGAYRAASAAASVAEGAGALALAAALELPHERRGRTVCPVTGGSIDPDKLRDILAGA